MPDNDLKPIKPEEAARQAADFLGVFSGVEFDLGDNDTWTLPNPSYLPPDMRKRYLEHLRHINEDVDTETISSENPVTGRTSSHTQKKWPLRIDGELIDEDELLCRALMTDEVYERFITAGGVPGQIQLQWRVMNLQMEERMRRDPKSR